MKIFNGPGSIRAVLGDIAGIVFLFVGGYGALLIGAVLS